MYCLQGFEDKKMETFQKFTMLNTTGERETEGRMRRKKKEGKNHTGVGPGIDHEHLREVSFRKT